MRSSNTTTSQVFSPSLIRLAIGWRSVKTLPTIFPHLGHSTSSRSRLPSHVDLSSYSKIEPHLLQVVCRIIVSSPFSLWIRGCSHLSRFALINRKYDCTWYSPWRNRQSFLLKRMFPSTASPNTPLIYSFKRMISTIWKSSIISLEGSRGIASRCSFVYWRFIISSSVLFHASIWLRTPHTPVGNPIWTHTYVTIRLFITAPPSMSISLINPLTSSFNFMQLSQVPNKTISDKNFFTIQPTILYRLNVSASIIIDYYLPRRGTWLLKRQSAFALLVFIWLSMCSTAKSRGLWWHTSAVYNPDDLFKYITNPSIFPDVFSVEETNIEKARTICES